MTPRRPSLLATFVVALLGFVAGLVGIAFVAVLAGVFAALAVNVYRLFT